MRVKGINMKFWWFSKASGSVIGTLRQHISQESRTWVKGLLLTWDQN